MEWWLRLKGLEGLFHCHNCQRLALDLSYIHIYGLTNFDSLLGFSCCAVSLKNTDRHDVL